MTNHKAIQPIIIALFAYILAISVLKIFGSEILSAFEVSLVAGLAPMIISTILDRIKKSQEDAREIQEKVHTLQEELDDHVKESNSLTKVVHSIQEKMIELTIDVKTIINAIKKD